MKFYCKYATARYAHPMDKDRFEYMGANRVKVTGLHADFANHSWDSEAAQRLNRWSDDQREAMEDAILENADFTGGIIQVVKDAPVGTLRTLATGTCEWSTPTTEGPSVCGEPVAEGSDWYCDYHQAKLGNIEVERPTVVAGPYSSVHSPGSHDMSR